MWSKTTRRLCFFRIKFRRENMKKLLGGMMLCVALVGCGSKSNLNTLFTGKDEESVDSLLITAQLAFDKKDYDKAENAANKVLAMNPGIGDAAVILGFTSVARAGLHPL